MPETLNGLVYLDLELPRLWRDYFSALADTNQVTVATSSVELMDVPLDRIRVFCAAIVTFWDDAEYIYNESIEAGLTQDRAQRSWRSTAASDRVVR